jgi:hypothetical protein
MKRKWMRLSGLSALALMLTVWGCDNLSDSGSRLTGPSEQSDALIKTTGSGGSVIARETDATVGTVAAVIGKRGGVISIGEHMLIVPAGAVDRPTTFQMTKVPGKIEMGLTATQVTPNDVGHAGFNVPVTLVLSYANIEKIQPVRKLKVMWVKADGSTEVMPSQVYTSQKVVYGSLGHFSDYGVGWPEP